MLVEQPLPAYKGSEPFVFVCYAHADIDLVYPELTRLQRTGLHIWYDEGISPGSEWSAVLADAIGRCKVFLYLVTPNSVVSEHCRREVNFALEQSCEMLAVHLEETAVPPALQLSLSHRQAVLRHSLTRSRYEEKLDSALRDALGGQRPGLPPGSLLAPESLLTIGAFELDVANARLIDGEDQRSLDPKDLNVLLHLLERAPDVVPTDELLQRNWPGAVVGDNALHQVIARLRKAFGDDSKSPSYIETQARRGYRLIAPVGRGRVAESVPEKSAGRWRVWSAGVMAFAVVLGGLVWQQRDGLGPPSPELSRVAFAPFTDLGSGASESVATAVREDARHALADTNASNIRVVDSVDAADFIVHGSVRSVDDGFTFNLRLTRVADDAQMWSKVLEGELSQSGRFEQADYLAHMIRVVIGVSVGAAPATSSDEALRQYILGMVEFMELGQGYGGDWRAAENYLLGARRADPNFHWPTAQLAMLYKNRMGFTLTHEQSQGAAHRYARMVLSDGPTATFMAAAVSHYIDLDYEAALANFAHAHSQPGIILGEVESEVGEVLLSQGRIEEAIDRLETAVALGEGTNAASAPTWLAAGYLALGNWQQAYRWAERAEVASNGAELLHAIGLTRKVLAAHFLGDDAVADAGLQEAVNRFGQTRPEMLPQLLVLREHPMADRVIAEADVRHLRGELPLNGDFFWAEFHRGNLDRAFVWLNRAIENREHYLFPWLHRSELLDSLRDDPRFVRAMQRRAELESIGTPLSSIAYQSRWPEPVAYTVAVSDFEDLTPDGELSWLARGLSRELSAQIGQLAGYESSVWTNSAASNPTERTGSVDYLLSGQLHERSGQVVVSVEATNIATGQVEWSQAFEGTREDPYELQVQLAARVSRYFDLNVSDDEGGLRPTMAGPQNPAARGPYLQYLHHRWGGDPEAIRLWLERTLQIDPNWAVGHLDLAIEYLSRIGSPDRKRWIALARESFERAGRHLPEDDVFYKVVEGVLAWKVDNDPARAESLLRVAALRSPWPAAYVQFLLANGLEAEALAAFETIAAKGYRFPTVLSDLAIARAAVGDLEGAYRAAQEVENLVPPNTYSAVQMPLMILLPKTGRFSEARTHLAALDLLVEEGGPGSINAELFRTVLRFQLAIAKGDQEAARRIADSVVAGGPSPIAMSGYLLLDDFDSALREARRIGFYEPEQMKFYGMLYSAEQLRSEAIRYLRNSRGVTPQWQLELCTRASTLPASSGISCNPRNYQSEAK